MTLPLITIRPEPGGSATIAKAREMGLDGHAFPLFAVRPLAWQPVPRGEIDALLLGSANALRHAGPALDLYRGMPCYCVGDTTATAARDAGLVAIMTGSGGLQGVVEAIMPQHVRLLRLAGREHVELSPSTGIAITLREVYASIALPLPPELMSMLRDPALVLLHSGEAAAHFAACCDEAGIARGQITLAAIGPRVAERAGAGWRAIASAQFPNDTALLALASEMCHTFGPG